MGIYFAKMLSFPVEHSELKIFTFGLVWHISEKCELRDKL